MITTPLLGIALTLAVLGVLGGWFYWCGYAEEARQGRAFARRTLLWASVGLALGLALLVSDLGPVRTEQRMGLVAVTVCCFLLVYAAGWGVTAADDRSLELVNLTGRALQLSADPGLAVFYTLPATQEEPATVLPPVRPRTHYVVSEELGRLGAHAGRTDVFTIDAATARDPGNGRPILVKRLLPAVPVERPEERPESGIRW